MAIYANNKNMGRENMGGGVHPEETPREEKKERVDNNGQYQVTRKEFFSKLYPLEDKEYEEKEVDLNWAVEQMEKLFKLNKDFFNNLSPVFRQELYTLIGKWHIENLKNKTEE